MRYDILCILLSIFVSIANFSPTTENECKRNAEAAEAIEKRLASVRNEDNLRHFVACQNEASQSKPIKMYMNNIMEIKMARFDENAGKLQLLSWTHTTWDGEAWDNTGFENLTSVVVERPDIAVLSMETEDIRDERRGNRGDCLQFAIGLTLCEYEMVHTIRCFTDLTLWPYDRHTCIAVITSWSFTTERLVFQDDLPVWLRGLNSDGEWNLSVPGYTIQSKESFFYGDREYSQLFIDFVVDRLHSHLRRRFVAPAIIMMVMTLTALWLDPKSYERLAVASLNLVIHMICIQDLHWVLPRNSSTTVPNMLLFYISSFVLATVALLLTFLLGKIKDITTPAPKWISRNIDRLVASKAGHILLLGMLDPKIMAGIKTGADDTSDILSSEPKDFTWKYMAVFFGWLLFFSFFFTYILMYILLIPDSASRPPPIKRF